LKSNTRVETDDRQTYTNAFIKRYRKRPTHYTNNKTILGLGLQVRVLPMWILYSFGISWISIFSRCRIWVDFVNFVDCDF